MCNVANAYLRKFTVPVFCWLALCSAVAQASPPGLALAHVYEDGMPLRGYWVSEKLDGVRAYWDGERFLSRQGNVFHAPDWFTKAFPGQPMDGELWMGRGQFAELSGSVRRLEPEDNAWQQIRYMVFDLPTSTQSFSGRLQQMKALLNPPPSSFIAMIEQQPAPHHEGLMAMLDVVVAAGGEGLILHHGDSLYRAGRSDDVLKVKRYDDAEALVVGYTPGKGKFEGMLGALVVEGRDGRRFRLGTGFSDSERASPPAIGSTVTYKFFGLTATGLPRFASFMRIRDDEPAPEP